MKKILYILLIFIFFSACATKSKIEYRDREVVKYIATLSHDTLINHVHDSIYNNIYTIGDTVYNIKYKEKISFRDKIVYRTDTIQRDSIQIVSKENLIIRKQVPYWCWYLLAFNIILIIFVIIKIYAKWRIKI